MDAPDPIVIEQQRGRGRWIILNRPGRLNSLDLYLVRALVRALDRAVKDPAAGFVVLAGAGDRAFCAGGDIKAVAGEVRNGNFSEAERFFHEEYALDLMIHRFPKPVIAQAMGVAMGGGLGLSAGADTVIACPETVMAMPETRIGFFPDVGASRWLFDKCPPGYPFYLALTGHELSGRDCVRAGLATHYTEDPEALAEILALLDPPQERAGFGAALTAAASGVLEENPAHRPARDTWVRELFANQTGLCGLAEALKKDASAPHWSADALDALARRSPTALSVAFALLIANRNRPLEQALALEARAAAWIIRQPDYAEGVRAQVVDKDHNPKWDPPELSDVDPGRFGFLDPSANPGRAECDFVPFGKAHPSV